MAMIELVDTVMDARASQPNRPALGDDMTGKEVHATAVRRHALERAGTDPELVQMLLTERRQWAEVDSGDAPADLPDIVSASALLELAENRDRFLRRRRRPLPAPPSAAAETGTRLHAWIEQHYARPTLWEADTLGHEAPGAQAGPGSAVEDASGSQAALTHAMQQNFLNSQWAGRTPVEIELPITTRLAGRTVRGRIDAVFERAGGGYTVVDWKSGPVPSEVALDKRAMQLEVYRLAYARLREVPPSMVDAAFYFAAEGKTIWPALPTAERLEDKVYEAFVGPPPTVRPSSMPASPPASAQSRDLNPND